MRRFGGLLFATCLASAQGPTFRATAPLVIAHTTVTGQDGRSVSGLRQGDFVVYDDGVIRPAILDESFAPVSLVLAIQADWNGAKAINKLQGAASLFQSMLAGDGGEVAILAYNDEVQIVQPFTSDADRISKAMKRLDWRGAGNAAVDAVIEGLRLLDERGPGRRQVILLIGESKDRASKGTLTEALTLAQRQNATIYTLSYSSFLMPLTGTAVYQH
jgi:VWFA-related protein